MRSFLGTQKANDQRISYEIADSGALGSAIVKRIAAKFQLWVWIPDLNRFLFQAMGY
jgi:hypothetical protein